MTLEEAIKDMETIAEENQKVVDTHIVFDDVTVDMLYCDDTEVIEEHLANYQMCAEEHRQLAEWLKDYKRLLEQEPKTGHWIAQDIHNCHTDFKCSECGYIHSFMHLYGKPTADYNFCPNCGTKMESEVSEWI